MARKPGNKILKPGVKPAIYRRSEGVPSNPEVTEAMRAPVPMRPARGESSDYYCGFLMAASMGERVNMSLIARLLGKERTTVREGSIRWRWRERCAAVTESATWGAHLLREIFPEMATKAAMELLGGIDGVVGTILPKAEQAAMEAQGISAGEIVTEAVDRAIADEESKPARPPREVVPVVVVDRTRPVVAPIPIRPVVMDPPAPAPVRPVATSDGPPAAPTTAPPADVPTAARTPEGASSVEVEEKRRRFAGTLVHTMLVDAGKKLSTGDLPIKASDVPQLIRVQQLLSGAHMSGPLPSERAQADTVRLRRARDTGDREKVLKAIEEDALDLITLVRCQSAPAAVAAEVEPEAEVIPYPGSRGN